MSTIAEDIRAAAASLSSTPEPGGTTGTAPEPAAAPTKAVSEPSGTTGRDAQGRFAPRQGDKPAENAVPVPSKSATESAPVPTAPPRRGPPKSFRPTVHGHWDKVPTEVQEEILRVDGATQELAKRFSQANNTHKQFNDFLNGYRPYIQGDPFQWLGSLAQTAVRLQTAPKRDRAAVLAQMARQFDVEVDDLDDALAGIFSGQAPKQPAHRGEPEADNPLMTRIQELEQRLSHMSLAPMIEEFTKSSEFLDEPMPGRDDLKVRDMVAHHLRTAAQANLALTPQEAYAQVIATHPTIQAVLKQREEAKVAAEQQHKTARAEAASRSVRTEPVVATASQGSKGRTIDDVRATAAMLRNRS